MVSPVTKWIIIIFVFIFILPPLAIFIILNSGIKSANLMGTLGIICGIVIPIITIGSLFYWIFTFQNKRQKDLKKFSEELGLAYGSDEGNKIYSEIKNFELFDGGRGKLPQIWHIITGKWKGIPLVVFDYRYQGGTIQGRILYYQTIVYAKTKKTNYKKTKINQNDFTIEAEGNKVICYKKSYFVNPKDLKDFLDESIEQIKQIGNN